MGIEALTTRDDGSHHGRGNDTAAQGAAVAGADRFTDQRRGGVCEPI